MEKIYQRAEDKNVAVRVVYANPSDSKLYFEPEFETEVPAEEMKNLFLKGVVCDNGSGIFAAVSYDETNGITFANTSDGE